MSILYKYYSLIFGINPFRRLATPGIAVTRLDSLNIPIPQHKRNCSFCMSSLWSIASRRGLQVRATPVVFPSPFTQRLKRLPPARPFNWTPKQNAQYQIQPRFTGPQYQRFSKNKIPFYQSKRFWVTTGTGTVLFGGYYVTHLETVPISGRTRFMDITPRQEEGMRHKFRACVCHRHTCSRLTISLQKPWQSRLTLKL